VEGKEESSFCEQKEAKKLHPLAAGSLAHLVSYEKKFFCFFFFKKRRIFLPATCLAFLGFSGERGKAKKLYSLAAGSLNRWAPSPKSFFASFFSKKEDSSCHLPFRA
jgi:hypothetical protein